MNRELDGCYFRIVRNGVGQSVCFTDLTKEERDTLLADKDVQFLKNLCCYLADQKLGDILEEQSKQLLLNDLAMGRASGGENSWIASEDVRQHFANIFTLDPKYDIFLTVFSALAQNESYSIAENIRWGIRKRFRRGIPQINLNRMLGYDMGKDGRWVINQEQAEIVRYIYDRYLQGHSARGISEELNDSSTKTINGKNWCTTGILCILENEKYVGDLLIQKTYTKDVLNHRPVENNGELPRYYILNHHEAIISREDWIEVQRKICGRARKRKEFNMVQQFILEESRMLS